MWGLSSHDGFGENQNYLGYHLLPLMFRAMEKSAVKFPALIYRLQIHLYIQCNFYNFYGCPTFHCNPTVLFTFNYCSKYSENM